VLEGAAKSLANVTGLTERLRKAGISALIDDRADISAGEKFADADLLGMPYQIILGSRFDGQRVEVKARSSGAIDMVDIEVLSERLRVVES
jgi:prolyl-tRNA synthetase